MATTIADSFQQSLAHGATWDFVVADTARSNCRIGWFGAIWDAVDDSAPEAMTEASSMDVGNTSDVSFSVDKSGSTVRLNYDHTGSWDIKIIRRLLCQ